MVAVNAMSYVHLSAFALPHLASPSAGLKAPKTAGEAFFCPTGR